ncbi:MAG TPA: hypothetical protein VHX38_02310 [Pseudonocardiaceae bacterium]|jgi:hypothetical protein|nr:hypothetical protein [Pseudonocardiaceae bacterium]
MTEPTVIRAEPGESLDAFIARVVTTAQPLTADERDQIWPAPTAPTAQRGSEAA